MTPSDIKPIVQFRAAARHAAAQLKDSRPGAVVFLHHNDSDGLACGALISRALERVGIGFHRYCLEKPYPQVLQRLFDDSLPQSTTFIIADFGSGMLPEIARINAGRFEVLVLDHHSVAATGDRQVTVLNPLSFGMLGEDASASVVCFEFARELSEWNEELAPLGLLGAFGDSLLRDGKFGGLAAELWQSACASGCARQVGERFELFIGDWCDASELVRLVDTLGSIGYFKGGTDVALKAIGEGAIHALRASAKRFEQQRKECFSKASATLQLHSEPHLQWFNLAGSFGEIGVKSVGLFCQELLSDGRIDQNKYLAGFQHIPDSIPGLGPFAFGQTKISMRVPAQLARRVRDGSAPGLHQFLPEATRRVGGFVDAAHPLAAATTVEIGRERELINTMESVLGAGAQ